MNGKVRKMDSSANGRNERSALVAASPDEGGGGKQGDNSWFGIFLFDSCQIFPNPTGPNPTMINENYVLLKTLVTPILCVAVLDAPPTPYRNAKQSLHGGEKGS